MRVPFRVVDVFTDRPFAGNQLCVVPDPIDVPTELMQALAKEIGFSETTFVTAVAPERYAMRIFTPNSEIFFAGHPSLGTAFVLVSEGRVASPCTQVLSTGEYPITVDVPSGLARMRQGPPVFDPPLDANARSALALAVGLTPDDFVLDLPVQRVGTGFGHLTAPLRDVAAL